MAYPAIIMGEGIISDPTTTTPRSRHRKGPQNTTVIRYSMLIVPVYAGFYQGAKPSQNSKARRRPQPSPKPSKRPIPIPSHTIGRFSLSLDRTVSVKKQAKLRMKSKMLCLFRGVHDYSRGEMCNPLGTWKVPKRAHIILNWSNFVSNLDPLI